jgi:predicted TIM-barrel fold metal-dependent hydrolase
MIEDVFVIDGVVHGYNCDPANYREQPWDPYKQFLLSLSGDDPEYLTTREVYSRAHDGEALASALFAESQTDMACYHHVTAGVLAYSPTSPMRVGKEADSIAPGRLFFYGGASDIFDTPRAVDEIERQVEEDHIVGVKFMGFDLYEGKTGTFRLDDERYSYPVLELLESHNLTPAIDKNAGTFKYGLQIDDLWKAAVTFPNLNFEIVHGGTAFLDEVVCLAYLPNIYINLEVTAGFMYRAPRRFAEILGRLLQHDGGFAGPGAEDRIIWASGCLGTHPRALLEKFWEFEMPADLVEERGYPVLTKEIKRKILGANWAGLHGMDIAALEASVPDDDLRRRQLAGDFAKPWSAMEASLTVST